MSPTEIAMRARGVRSWVAEIRDEIDKLVPECRSFKELVERMEADGFSVERSRRGLGFRHPESCGSDKKVLAAKLGLRYTEAGLKGRVGCDFRPHRLRRAPAPVPISIWGHGADSGPRRGGLRTSSGWRGRSDSARAGRSPTPKRSSMRWPRQRTESVTSAEGLRSLLEDVRVEVKALESKSDEMGAAVREVAAALDSAREVAAAREELSGLPAGAWSRDARLRRNLLIERITDGEASVERVLSTISALHRVRRIWPPPMRPRSSGASCADWRRASSR